MSYGIDQASLVVWVDNRAVFERELAGRLCRRHADALVVPRGWTLDDRREPVPKLFVTKDHPAPAEARATRRAPSRRSDAPDLDQELPWVDSGQVPDDTSFVHEHGDSGDASEPDVAHVETADPDETRAVPWSPRLVPTEPDDPSGPVFGRLLGRAFGNRGRDEPVAGDG